MNDPYAQKRNELCIKESHLHFKHCEGCSKLVNLYNRQGERADQCRVCDIGAQLRELGEEMLKYSRPRVNAPVTPGINFLDYLDHRNEKRKKHAIISESKIDEYKELRKQGLKKKEIAALWCTSEGSVKHFASKHNLNKKRVV